MPPEDEARIGHMIEAAQSLAVLGGARPRPCSAHETSPPPDAEPGWWSEERLYDADTGTKGVRSGDACTGTWFRLPVFCVILE